MIGGFNIVILTGKVKTSSLLKITPALTIVAILILITPQLLADSTPIIFILLGLFLAGYAYGAFIAIYPVAVTDRFGVASSARAYGQIFYSVGLSSAFWARGSVAGCTTAVDLIFTHY